MVFGFFRSKKDATPEDPVAKAPPATRGPAKAVSFEEAFALQVAQQQAPAGFAVQPGAQLLVPKLAPADVVAQQPLAVVVSEPFAPEPAAVMAPQPAVPEPVALVVPAALAPEAVETAATPVVPQTPQAPVGQMDTIKATREDVIAAYKIFLGRLPESMAVVDPRVGVTPAALLLDFLSSSEFLGHPPREQLVLDLARQILLARKAQLGEPAVQAVQVQPAGAKPLAGVGV